MEVPIIVSAIFITLKIDPRVLRSVHSTLSNFISRCFAVNVRQASYFMDFFVWKLWIIIIFKWKVPWRFFLFFSYLEDFSCSSNFNIHPCEYSREDETRREYERFSGSANAITRRHWKVNWCKWVFNTGGQKREKSIWDSLAWCHATCIVSVKERERDEKSGQSCPHCKIFPTGARDVPSPSRSRSFVAAICFSSFSIPQDKSSLVLHRRFILLWSPVRSSRCHRNEYSWGLLLQPLDTAALTEEPERKYSRCGGAKQRTIMLNDFSNSASSKKLTNSFSLSFSPSRAIAEHLTLDEQLLRLSEQEIIFFFFHRINLHRRTSWFDSV